MKTLNSLFVASAVTACLLLTGCSANPASTGVSETNKSAGVGTKGVRACITNNTEKPVKIFFWGADSQDALSDNILRPDQTTCGEGTTVFKYWDLQFTVRFRDNTDKDIYLKNQQIGWPLVTDDLEYQTAADQKCGFAMKGPMGQAVGISLPCSDDFSAGETHGYTSYNNNKLQHLVNVTRLEDSNWKDFQVNIIR
jgi:hypothetical protein